MRFLIVVLVAVLATLQLKLWLSDGGMREVWRLEAEVSRRTAENDRLAARNAALEAEVRDLKQVENLPGQGISLRSCLA